MKSPLYDSERSHGGHFASNEPWEIVEHYGNPDKEYDAVCLRTGALDLCYLGKLGVAGRDRTRFLHNLLSNDIKRLSPGEGCHAALLTRQGQMESDLYVFVFPDELLLECPPAGSARVFETLSASIVGDVVQIDDRAQRLAVLSLQGPEACERMQKTTGRPLEDLPLLHHRTVLKPSGSWSIVRRDRTGCDGYDLWLPAGDAEPVWTRWLDSEGIQPVGHEALNRLRTEAGIPWYGVDMQSHNLPMEFGLDSAISLNKGCYRGQEIVARVLHRGHLDRRLSGIAIRDGGLPARGAEVHAGGAKAGAITSAVYSPRLGCTLALAIVKNDFREQGTKVEVLYGKASYPGEIVTLPLSRQ